MKWRISAVMSAAVLSISPLHAGQLHILKQDGAQAMGSTRDVSIVVATKTAGPFAPPSAISWNTTTGEESVLTGMNGATGINSEGAILGSMGIDGGAGQGGSDYAVVLDASASAVAPLLPQPVGGDSTLGSSIADSGDVAGSYYTSTGTTRAVVWEHGAAMMDLPVRDPSQQSAAYAISRDADGSVGHAIAGFVGAGDGFGTQNGVIWLGAQHLPTYPVNDDGHAVGPALGLSSDGRFVVGSTYDTVATGHVFEAWLWDAQTNAVRRIPGMDIAQAVSLDGRTVIGTRGFPTRVSMVWREGRGTTTLRDFLEENDISRPAGWVKPEGSMNLMSDDGRVIGGCCVPMPDGIYGHSYLVSGEPIGSDRLFADSFEEGSIRVDAVMDGGFEATTDNGGFNPAWESFDGNPDAVQGGSLFFDESRFLGSAARHGLWMALFGGYLNGAAEMQTIQQAVPFPKDDAVRLRYAYYIAYNADAPARLVVSVDGQVVDMIDAAAQLPMTDYASRTIDVSAFADGTRHELVFRYEYAGGAQVDGELFVDDVQVGTVRPIRRDAQ